MYNDEVREHCGISKDCYPIPTAKKKTNLDQNKKYSINEPIKQCPECGSNNLVTDPTHAEKYCADCGMMIEENQFIHTIDIANIDRGFYDPYHTKSLTLQQISNLIPNPISPKKLSSLTGAPLPSEQDKFVEDITNSVLQEAIQQTELRNNIRDEIIKKVQHEYKELYKNGFKRFRFGRIGYRHHMVNMLAKMELNNNKEVNKHHPEPFTVVIPERLINENFEPYKNLYLAIHDPTKKKREKMYRYADGLSDELLTIDCESGSRNLFFGLLVRANKIGGGELRSEAEQRGLTYKEGFMVCLAIYSIKAMEKHDGCKYLKSKKEILKVLKIPETTYDDRMKELRMID